ncbi:MAG: UDP-N-acetylmuramoyl-tripeptide--D-alanyl-D-alanine ligase [Oenococcus sp.]|uniref:UDP-N-acetylmuramoyl-tripeptide--D-alanyl-D- alanine ligase n=1 Tax=Oenococcus TaxID=46254 RepID=UPI0021E96BDB|nr:UDP-N-acetylmuramoyl-tripeptide--D-alanyl-D-alanine ligase [Oenococcus kitaharae]MCV3296423.1 UDP-N-acetylmuramoyl-tripeptide--D-alanyl-D-alanine ligase [Oenococcus kitaharae]
MKYSLSQVNEIVHGRLLNIDEGKARQLFVTSVDFDSRRIRQNGLFLPISDHDHPKIHAKFAGYTIAGVDGHLFIDAAAKKGAAASLADHFVDSKLPIIQVEDTQLAFWQLAADYLKRINPTRIAVTGSNGKTTTKDLIASILATKYRVHHTEASNNNEIGLPKTILDMPEDTQIAVFEIGMDRPGQLTALSGLVQPDIALITMIGEAHIAFFKTRQRIADAKMEIIAGLKKDGTFIYDGDEPLLTARAGQFAGRKITFGLGAQNRYKLEHVSSNSTLSFDLNQQHYQVNLLGAFNAKNAAAAIAAAECFELAPSDIQRGLNQLQLTKNRLQLLNGSQGEKIISDVYNSNPTAAREAIHILQSFPSKGHKFLVLGDMLELGDQAAAMHMALKEPIQTAGFDHVYLVGPLMQNLARDLNAPHYDQKSLDRLTTDLKAQLSSGDVVLLKASHGLHLEKVEQSLI